MARYGRDYGSMRAGYDAGYRARGYDEGYARGWGMEGLFNSIVGRSGERGGHGGGSRARGGYDRDVYRRDYGRERQPSPYGGMNPGGRSRFGSGYGGSERGEDWRGFGGRPRGGYGYDRSFGSPRIDRSRYDRGWP